MSNYYHYLNEANEQIYNEVGVLKKISTYFKRKSEPKLKKAVSINNENLYDVTHHLFVYLAMLINDEKISVQMRKNISNNLKRIILAIKNFGVDVDKIYYYIAKKDFGMALANDNLLYDYDKSNLSKDEDYYILDVAALVYNKANRPATNIILDRDSVEKSLESMTKYGYDTREGYQSVIARVLYRLSDKFKYTENDKIIKNILSIYKMDRNSVERKNQKPENENKKDNYVSILRKNKLEKSDVTFKPNMFTETQLTEDHLKKINENLRMLAVNLKKRFNEIKQKFKIIVKKMSNNNKEAYEMTINDPKIQEYLELIKDRTMRKFLTTKDDKGNVLMSSDKPFRDIGERLKAGGDKNEAVMKMLNLRNHVIKVINYNYKIKYQYTGLGFNPINAFLSDYALHNPKEGNKVRYFFENLKK
jgi:hypothetical protein